MGWLLTIWLSLPLVASEVEIKMWFSRKSYCTFAKEKFLENPIVHRVEGTDASEATMKHIECRELTKGEASLIPEHMR